MNQKTRFHLDKDTVARDELVEVKAVLLPQEEKVQIEPGKFVNWYRMPKKFECKIGGKLAFSAEFGPSTSASAYLQFKIKVRESAQIVATWTNFDDSLIPGGSGEIRVV